VADIIKVLNDAISISITYEIFILTRGIDSVPGGC